MAARYSIADLEGPRRFSIADFEGARRFSLEDFDPLSRAEQAGADIGAEFGSRASEFLQSLGPADQRLLFQNLQAGPPVTGQNTPPTAPPVYRSPGEAGAALGAEFGSRASEFQPEPSLALLGPTGGQTQEGRALYRNSQGGVSSEYSITVTDPRLNGGRPTNIPSIYGGKIVPQDEAIQRAVDTGGKDPETGLALPGFKTIEEAETAARVRSEQLAPAEYGLGSPFARGYRNLLSSVGVAAADFQTRRLKSLLAWERTLDAGDKVAERTAFEDMQKHGMNFDPIRFRDEPEYRQQVKASAEADILRSATGIVGQQAKAQAIPQSEHVKRAMQGDFWKEFAKAPLSIIYGLSAESLPQMIPGLLAAPFTGGASVALNSFIAEQGPTMLETFRELGVDVTDPQALKEAFTNPEIFDKAKEAANAKGLPIALFDAVSVGLASRLLIPRKVLAGRPVVREVANVGAQLPAQAALGMAGEATGQLAHRGEIYDPAGVYAEGIAEIGGAPVEVATMSASRIAGAARKRRFTVEELSDVARQEPTVAPPGPPAAPESAGAGVAPPPAETVPVPPPVVVEPKPVPVVPEPTTPAPPAATPPSEVSPGALPSGWGTADLASKATVATVVALPEPDAGNIRFHQGDGYISDGRYLLPETDIPALAAASRNKSGVGDLDKAKVKALFAQYNKGKKTPFEAVFLNDPKTTDPESRAAPRIIGRAGDEWIAFDARYYTYFTEQGFEIRGGAARDEKTSDRPFGLYKDGKLRGILMPIRLTEDAATLNARAATLTEGPAPTGTKYQPPRLGVPRSPAQTETALDRAARQRAEERDRPDAGTIKKAKPIQAAKIEELKALEQEAALLKVKLDDARQTQTDVESAAREAARKQSESHPGVGRTNYSEGFMAAWESDTARLEILRGQAKRAGTDKALEKGIEAGENHRQLTPPVELADDVFLEFDIETARGRKTHFKVPADPERIAEIRRSFEGTANVQRLYSETPETFGMEPGGRYVGSRGDFVDEGVTEDTAADPVRREHILSDLESGLGVKIYQGRVKGKRRLGYFRRPVEEVRIKNRSDIEVAAHEIAHVLDYRIPEIRKQWFPARNANKAVREELRSVSYDASKLYEGFAEYVRLWSTQPEKAKAAAPQFTEWWEGFLERSEHGPVIRRAKKQMLEWFNQGLLQRARSKVGEGGRGAIGRALSMEPKEYRQVYMDGYDRFRQAYIDDLHGIYRAEKDIFGEIRPLGMYEKARLSRSSITLMEGAFLDGAPRFMSDGRVAFVDQHGQPRDRYTTKAGRLSVEDNPTYREWGLKHIFGHATSKGGTLQDFGLYAVGRRAQVLKGQGRENLFTPGEIAAMRALETPEYRAAFQMWNTFNRQLLDFAQKAGVIDPIGRQSWESDVYLPFWRVGGAEPGTMRSGGTTGAIKLIRRLTGGTANIGNPIQNMLKNTRMLMETAIANEARQGVISPLLKAEGGARHLVEIAKDTRSVSVSAEQLERFVFEDILGLSIRQVKAGNIPEEAQAIAARMMEMPEFVKFWQFGQTPRQTPGGPPVIAFMQHGKPRYVEVANELTHRALMAMPRRYSQHLALRLLRTARRIGQMTVTLTYDFLVRNLVRDQVHAKVFTQHGYVPFVDSIRGFKNTILRNPVYRDWLANGGGMASFFSEEGRINAQLAEWYKKHSIPYELVINTPRKMFWFLERISESAEIATRLGEYRRAVGHGVQPRRAGFLSREVSTDFAMRGDSAVLGVLLDSVIFLKAGIAGVDRVYRGFATDPVKARTHAMVWTTGIAAAGLGLWAINQGNPLYDELEKWDKDSHYHFYIPKAEHLETYYETGSLPDIPAKDLYNHFRMPRAWEIGAIGRITELWADAMVNGATENVGADTARVVREAFRFNFLPHAIQPAVDVWRNRISFFDRSIESMSMQRREPWARYGPHTSKTMVWYGQEVGRHLPKDAPDWLKSPAKMESLIRGYFNGWALYGFQTADRAFFDDAMDFRMDEIPGLKTFYQQHPSKHSRYVTELQDAIAEIEDLRGTIKFMAKTGQKEITDELIEERPELRAYQVLHAGDRAMEAVSQNLQRIMLAPDLGELKQYASDLGRHPLFRDKISALRRTGDWNDLGGLKMRLRDMWLEHRNDQARKFMQRAKPLMENTE